MVIGSDRHDRGLGASRRWCPDSPRCSSARSIMGVSFMLFQVPAQNATGELGDVEDRPHNYSTLALGYAISGFLGPLVAGFTIDHGGFAVDVRACSPCCRWFRPSCSRAACSRCRGRTPRTRKAPPRRRVRARAAPHSCGACSSLNLLFSVAWELHTIVIPVYGARIGLSASAIGLDAVVVRRGDVRRALLDALDRPPPDRAPGAHHRAVHRGDGLPALPVLARARRR